MEPWFIRVWISFSLVKICNSRTFKPFSHFFQVNVGIYTYTKPVVPWESLPWASSFVPKKNHGGLSYGAPLEDLWTIPSCPSESNVATDHGEVSPTRGFSEKKHTRKTWGLRTVCVYMIYTCYISYISYILNKVFSKKSLHMVKFQS